MKICIAYSQRLGDVIRVLPIARHFAADGNKVSVECLAPYHEFFDCVSYCKPTHRSDRASHGFDMVFDLEIWPRRYDEFVASGQSWLDFVYASSPLLTGIDRKPVFDLIDETPSLTDYGLSNEINIFSPFGYSQRNRYTVASLAQTAIALFSGRFVALADPAQAGALLGAGIDQCAMLTAKRSAHLPRLLRDAKSVFTTNSAPSIICGAVRDEFWHVLEGDPQNENVSPASKIVTPGA